MMVRNDLFRFNYIQKLSRLKSCLRLWSSRDITPMGRITLVKSLALSQLVFLFLVLPDPPASSFIKELEKVIFDFIWQGNPDKVKRSVLINDIQKGGLKAVHIKSFINGLNCTWVRRYCDNSKGLWKLFFDFELDKYGKEFLLHCNCASQDIRINNLFIRQVVHAWCEATYCMPTCPDDVKLQLIWNNSSVKIDKKLVFDKYLYDKGILYVQDCFDENGTPFTYEDFTTNYDILNFPFTRYWGLINAIPRNWRVSGGLGENRVIYLKNSHFTKALNCRSFSQAVYNFFLEKISETPTSIKKWNDLFDDLRPDNWERIFKMPWASVNDAKIRYFQFKFCTGLCQPTDF